VTDTFNLERVRRALIERRRTETMERWLRVVGYVTRPVVYLVPMGLLVLLLWSATDGFSQPLSHFALRDFFKTGGLLMGLVGATIPIVLFFSTDGDDMDWHAWGKFGLGVVAGAAVAALWLGYR
jgi:hypothetical protein